MLIDKWLREMEKSTCGARGYLRLGFEYDGLTGRSILRDWERRAPMIVQQALYFDQNLRQIPCVYILSSGGPTLQGDYSEQIITLGEGAEAHISTGAATKIAPMDSGSASFVQRFSLGRGSYLEYLPEVVIPTAGSRLDSLTEIEIDDTATMFHAEWFLSGRVHHNGERFLYDRVALEMRVMDSSKRELYCDRSVIEPTRERVDVKGRMAGYDIFANILILLPKEHLERVYERIVPSVDRERGVALGVLRLPYGRGVICRVLGRRTVEVKQTIRGLCSILREEIKGCPLPEEFAWR